MDWLTNEMLFYGGIIMCGGTLLFAGIYFFISKIKSIKLRNQLEAEYGSKINK